MTFGWLIALAFGFNPPSSRPIDRFWRRLRHPERGPSGWRPLVALLLLSAGSLTLLPGPGVWLATGETWAFSLAVVGVVFLFVGWMKLGLDIAEVRRDPGPHPTLRRRLMWTAYGVSWIALVLGLIALSGQISIPPPPPLAREILRGFFPYIPSVYAPLVLGQAAVLLLGVDVLVHPRGRRIVILGVSLLLVISSTAMAVQLRGPLGPAALLLAGSTGFGYLLVAIAWLVYEPSSTPTRDRHRGAKKPSERDKVLPDLRTWRRWGQRRKAWAALVPGVLISFGGYLLALLQECVTPETCTRPFATLGLGILGFGLFLIILGLVLWATS